MKLSSIFKHSLVLLLIFSSFGFEPETTVKDLAWGKYITSQKKFQVAVHHLLRLNWPNLRKVVDQSQEFQLGTAEMKNQRFLYLLENKPDQIDRKSGFHGFVNFHWTEDDESALKKENSEFRSLAKKTAKLRDKLDNNPLYSEMVDRMASLEGEREYIEVMARFRFVSKEVEALLN